MSDNVTSNVRLDGGGVYQHHHSQWSSSTCDPGPPVGHFGRQASSAEYGYGPSYSKYPRAVSDPNDNGLNFSIAKRFVFNQRVNVNIDGRGWLIGTVVAILTAMKTLTGSHVRVKYAVPYDPREHMTDVPDDPRFIRPLT